MKKRIWFPIMALTAVISFLFVSCGKKGSDAVASPTWAAPAEEAVVISVESLTVEKGKVYPYVEASGVVSGINEVEVVSESQGIIKWTAFQIGSKVFPGQVLLAVDDAIPLINLEQAKQQYENALIDLRTTEALFNQGNASQAELTRKQSAANGMKSMYETTMKIYADTQLKAPITGEIAWKNTAAAAGNYLSPGLRVARIVDTSAIRIELAVGERQVGLIREGASAVIRIPAARRNETLSGKVQAIAAGSDAATGSFTVIVVSENSFGEAVRAGMSATVLIDTPAEENVVIVPSRSIVVRGGKEYVFLDDNGTALSVEIQRGEGMGERVAVLEGLSGGETLIVSALSSLKPGTRVNTVAKGGSGGNE